MPESADSIRRRIIDVCLLMESDLAYPYSIQELADYAGMSKHHFQRQFRRVVGETAMAHLRRLRLARAATFLKNSDASITRVAHESGFDTHAGFTHAFSKLYGCSPQQLRNNQRRRPYLRLPSAERMTADAQALAACPLSVTIEHMPTWQVALMRYVGPTNGMASIWSPMSDWLRRRNLLDTTQIYLGIYHDDWHPERPDDYSAYRYDAAVVVNAAFAPDDDVNTTIIPGGDVATVFARGSVAKLERMWKRFVEEWLPISGYQPRLSTVFDIYSGRLIAGSRLRKAISTLTGIEAKLCIPVSRVATSLSSPER